MKVINTYIVRFTTVTLLYEVEGNLWFLSKPTEYLPLSEISEYEAQSLILDSSNYISEL